MNLDHPTIQSFPFPGTSVTFSHALVTPGDIQQLETGFRFTATGQTFLWRNPDIHARRAEQAAQQPATAQTDTQPLSMEVARISDSARDVQDSHFALNGVSRQPATSSIQQETLSEAAASELRRTSAAARPELNPAITINSPPDHGAMVQKAQASSGDPKTASTSRQGQLSTVSYDDGSSALAGWYGEGKGVGKMDLSRTRIVAAPRPIAAPSGSRIVSAPDPTERRSENRTMAANAYPTAVSYTSYSANQEPHTEAVSDYRDPQPPHTSDGIARRAELAGFSGGTSYIKGSSYIYPASAAPMSSTFQVSNPSGTTPAVGQRPDPTLYIAPSIADQPGASTFGVDARRNVQQLSVGTVCGSREPSTKLISFISRANRLLAPIEAIKSRSPCSLRRLHNLFANLHLRQRLLDCLPTSIHR